MRDERFPKRVQLDLRDSVEIDAFSALRTIMNSEAHRFGVSEELVRLAAIIDGDDLSYDHPAEQAAEPE